MKDSNGPLAHQDGVRFLEAVERAIAFGGGAHGVDAAELFNVAAGHMRLLLGDACDAFRRQSFGTCAFLAITALEETSKAEILAFRVKLAAKSGKPRGRDPLLDHRSKHLLSVRPTTFMGRLPDILGPERCARLQREAEAGDLVALRERALYVHVDERGVSTPRDAISAGRAGEVLLLALESADDILVGWTQASFLLGEQFDAWITEFQNMAVE